MCDEQPDGRSSARRTNAGASNAVFAQLRADIKELRSNLAALELHVRNTSITGRLRRLGAFVLGADLHKLTQHRPRKLSVPAQLSQPLPLANPPIISISTPSFNQGRYLEQTIRSVLDQNYPALEYAVQDGGSKDESVAVMERYRDRLAHVESRKDKGQGHAINLGFAHATRGEIMAYLNSDDLLHARQLELRRRVLRGQPGRGCGLWPPRHHRPGWQGSRPVDPTASLRQDAHLGRLRPARDALLATTDLGQGWR